MKYVVVTFVVFIIASSLSIRSFFVNGPRTFMFRARAQLTGTLNIVSTPFRYTFNSSGTLQESGVLARTTSPYWWLNSGAYLYLQDGVGKTVQGALPGLNKWRLLYSLSNPTDTDNGHRPQNIFRLVTLGKWENVRQEAYFRIKKTNLSSSPNRNASNGLLLFHRYQDGNNLYYTGLRVDGSVVVKKKKDGIYYTLGYKKLYSGLYDPASNPNLLPQDTWIGIRSEVKNNADGTVMIKIFTDDGRAGTWTTVLETVDNGRTYGGAAIVREGHGGIRTDFMDIELDDYAVQNL